MWVFVLVLLAVGGVSKVAWAQGASSVDAVRYPVLGFELGIAAPRFSVGALLRRVGERGFVVAPSALSSVSLRVVAKRASLGGENQSNALRVELVETSQRQPARIVEVAEVEAGAPAVVELRLQHTIIALLESHRAWLLTVSQPPKRMFKMIVVGEGIDEAARTRTLERLTSGLWRAGQTIGQDDPRSEVVCVGLRNQAVYLTLRPAGSDCPITSALAGRPFNLAIEGWRPIEERLAELTMLSPEPAVVTRPFADPKPSRGVGSRTALRQADWLEPSKEHHDDAVEQPPERADTDGTQQRLPRHKPAKLRSPREHRITHGGPWTLDLRLGGAGLYRGAFDPWFSGESCLVRDPGHGLCIELRATPSRRLRPVMLHDAALMAWVNWSVAVHPKLRLQPQVGGGLAVHSYRRPRDAWIHELDPQAGLRIRLMVHLGDFFDMTIGVAGFYTRRSRAHTENDRVIWERHAFMVGPELSLGSRWLLK